MPPATDNRVHSIDILRALTMLLMIFVNDLWTLKDIPEWLEHTAAQDDGMGLADTVFPAFLFLVGMSIPLSIVQRRSKGDDNLKLLQHVLIRSVALLVMGVFLVNGETINPIATGVSPGTWFILCCSCFILIWNAWPKNMNIWIKRNLRGIGIIGLCLLAWIYRGGAGETPVRFAPQWWGILGLIGWGYMVTATICIFLGRRFLFLCIAWLLLLFLLIASHAAWLPNTDILKSIISPLGNGAMPALTMGGAIITSILFFYRQHGKEKLMLAVFALIAVILFSSGMLLREFWGISKIRATPSWVLICSAMTIIAFGVVYWLVDIKRYGNWFSIIKPAGTNTLLCYLLPYFAYGIVWMSGIGFPAFILTGGTGLIKSFLFALLIVLSAGLLGKAGLRLKL